ncbi:hypothetical protein MKW94_026738 [Papaver nudicaule]|uniref:Uncharacterized protein n=1 Tax=Papaver nudicaule TaxID=74823 RepID=A0AA41RYE4_PAPNU|nr:hypothetical protein [Papaver nudicaule]
MRGEREYKNPASSSRLNINNLHFSSASSGSSSMASDSPTIFDKIISKEIPSKVVYEDDKKIEINETPVRISSFYIRTLNGNPDRN